MATADDLVRRAGGLLGVQPKRHRQASARRGDRRGGRGRRARAGVERGGRIEQTRSRGGQAGASPWAGWWRSAPCSSPPRRSCAPATCRCSDRRSSSNRRWRKAGACWSTHVAGGAVRRAASQCRRPSAASSRRPIYAKIAGYLKEIRVDKGDRVTAGQVLAVLESPELDQQVANARANYELQLVTNQRNQELVKQALIAQQVADESRGAMLQAQGDAGAAGGDARLQDHPRPGDRRGHGALGRSGHAHPGGHHAVRRRADPHRRDPGSGARLRQRAAKRGAVHSQRRPRHDHRHRISRSYVHRHGDAASGRAAAGDPYHAGRSGHCQRGPGPLPGHVRAHELDRRHARCRPWKCPTMP